MSLPQTHLSYSVDEYLCFERKATERHEWLDGMIYAMAGESPEHSLISTNIVIALGSQLKGKPCAVFSPNMKVYTRLATDTTRRGLFAYPDVMVVCGQPMFHDTHRDVMVNPQVIIEVLSPSTERYDRGEKFARYRQRTSLTDYLLVSQSQPSIEHFTRQANDHWDYSCVSSLAGHITLVTIACQLHLADVYDRIVFPQDMVSDNPIEGSWGGPAAGQ